MSKIHLKQLAVFISSAIVLSSLMTGCQNKTFEKLTSQTIDVVVIDEQSHEILKNAHCLFSDKKNNTYPLKKNPGSVIFTDASNKLYLSCQAPDYYQTQIAITNKLHNWTYSDLTILPGHVIDTNPFPPPLYPNKLIVFMSNKPLPSIEHSDQQFSDKQKKDVFFQGTMK